MSVRSVEVWRPVCGHTIVCCVRRVSERAKDICMKRQQFLEDWVAYAKYTLLQQAEYADIPAQARWRKIMLDIYTIFVYANAI